MHKQNRIFVAGHRGLAGSAILRKLRSEGYTNLIVRSHAELDLTRQDAVEQFFRDTRPEYVFLAAARVGGIQANRSLGADFIRENLQIQTNTIDAAYRSGVGKLLFLGSSCIYPKLAPQPIREEYLLSGKLEPTNQPYAVAKIAGIEMARAYRKQYGFNTVCLMPTNLYGPGDNFDAQNSHVLPALIRRFHDAPEMGTVTVWGTGSARREFLHCDDLADAAVFLMLNYHSEEIVNVGVGEDISILELTKMIANTAGFRGAIEFDASKPDGTPRKLLDISIASNLGWRARIGLRQGIRQTWRWYTDHVVANSAYCASQVVENQFELRQ